MRWWHESVYPLAGMALAVTIGCASPGHAADLSRALFGKMPDGTDVEAITLSGGGISATIITFGASLQAVRVPDRAGHLDDVVLGYDTLDGYVTKPNYFGSSVGRYANRIGHGRFVLDGKSYQTSINDGPNSLHGGARGFDRKVWRVVSVEEGPVARVTLELVSPDGDQGYPGRLTATAIYALDEHGALSVTYQATTDKPTVVSMTNHAYWNLAGEGSPRGAMGMRLTMPAAEFTPVDAMLVPTGEFRAVAGTPFDFRRPTVINDRLRDGRDAQMRYGRGYDHNMVISRAPVSAPRLVAKLEDGPSGRVLEVLSTAPSVQFYSGNFLDGTITGKRGHIYRAGDAVALEAQLFPDTPNHASFGSARLAPGETYENRIVFRFSTTPE